MQAILGPSTIENGLDPETAFFACSSGGMAILGPARGPSDYVDPIAKFFVLLGKMIHVRRLVSPLEPGEVDAGKVTDHPVHQFGAVQAAFLAPEWSSEFDIVWKPLAHRIGRDVLDPLTRQTADLDQRIRRFAAIETHTVLAIDPTASVEQRMEDLNAYLQHRGYTLEQNSGGFHDFIARSFKDTQGNRIDLPTSTNPSFPDAWITPEEVITQGYGGSRREWSLIW